MKRIIAFIKNNWIVYVVWAIVLTIATYKYLMGYDGDNVLPSILSGLILAFPMTLISAFVKYITKKPTR
jgi:hypothetical protein